MPDCSNASITVGGLIQTIDAFDDLVAALDDEGGLDYEGDPEDGWEPHLLGIAETGEALVVCCHDMAGGQFPEIEAVCVKHGLPFRRADDGHYAYAPINCAFNLSTGLGVVEHGGTIDTGPQIELSSLATWLAQGRLEAEVAKRIEHFAEPPALQIAPEVLAAIQSRNAES